MQRDYEEISKCQCRKFYKSHVKEDWFQHQSMLQFSLSLEIHYANRFVIKSTHINIQLCVVDSL